MQTPPKDTVHVIIHQAENGGLSNVQYALIAIAALLVLWILSRIKPVRDFFKQIRPKGYELSIPGFSIAGELRYFSVDQDIAWKIYLK